MPPRRRTPPPTPIDVEAVRRKLAEGKIVRVGISRSAQFPDGATGRVRHVGDPAVDGDEFVQVELSLNGTRDVLPFTPTDLTPAGRAGPRAAVTIGDPAPGVARKAAPPTTEQSPPTITTETPPAAPPAMARPATTGPTAADEKVRAGRPAATGPAPAGPPATVSPGPSPTITPPPAGRPRPVRGAARRPPAVSITIATGESDPPHWRIEARVGTRVALRAGSVSPARVWELVRMLDDETLTRAVGSILDEQRRVAQARADALAAELAQVQAELAALPDGKA